MAEELPYLPSYKNVELLFTKIAAAKQPDAFTQKYLADTLGLKSTGDRSLIALLKTLGFLDGAGRPTATYGHLKNPTMSGAAVADAVRKAFAPLFAANENAHQLSPQDLAGLISQVAGTESGMTGKIAGTFRALVKMADFSREGAPGGSQVQGQPDLLEKHPSAKHALTKTATLSPEFHFNIQIHLPTNASEETYLNIFSALRKTFQ